MSASVRELARALASGDGAAVLRAGALVNAVVARHHDAAVGRRRAATMLEAVLLTADGALPDAVRRGLEHVIDDCVEVRGPATIGERLDALWHDLAGAFTSPACAARRAPVEDAIQEYLATTLCERARLGDLARMLGYSPAHVSTLVRRLTGRSFTALRCAMQLRRATWLLEQGCAVKVAALESGFTDPAYFSRVFARRFGVPPSRWRPRGRA